MRDIDTIIDELASTHPGLLVEQLKVLHPDADDAGLWFFQHPNSPIEVQLESSQGCCPFLFETNGATAVATADTIDEAVSLIANASGLRASTNRDKSKNTGFLLSQE